MFLFLHTIFYCCNIINAYYCKRSHIHMLAHIYIQWIHKYLPMDKEIFILLAIGATWITISSIINLGYILKCRGQ